MLRFSTAGSVDDGKSTLIGRLLHDTRQVLEDQLAALARASARRGLDAPDLSLLTDGLEAEREQGITIDVAYRYFATPRRKFIVADTPGHEQYTRNMATGASTADVAVVLADVRKGLLPQSRRHLYIAHLLGIRHVVVAVNKMDLAGYSREAFEAVRAAFETFAAPLAIPDLRFVPVSALHGDLVVERGTRMDWYPGPALLELLETLEPAQNELALPLRFPVQLVQRRAEARAYLGRVASGAVRVGDEVVALPSARRAAVSGIRTLEGERGAALAGDSVALLLAGEIDIARGDLIAEAGRAPRPARSLAAKLVWLGEDPAAPDGSYLLKHATRTVPARIAAVDYRVDVETLGRHAPGPRIAMNDIVRVGLQAQQPVFCDPYLANRGTGAFILIDPLTNGTVAAGMIE